MKKLVFCFTFLEKKCKTQKSNGSVEVDQYFQNLPRNETSEKMQKYSLEIDVIYGRAHKDLRCS